MRVPSRKVVLTESELICLMEDAFDAGRALESGDYTGWTRYLDEAIKPMLEKYHEANE